MEGMWMGQWMKNGRVKKSGSERSKSDSEWKSKIDGKDGKCGWESGWRVEER